MITSIMRKFAADITGGDVAIAGGLGTVGAITANVAPLAYKAHKNYKIFEENMKAPQAKIDAAFDEYRKDSRLLDEQLTQIDSTSKNKLFDLQRKYGVTPGTDYGELQKLHPEANEELMKILNEERVARDANSRAQEALASKLHRTCREPSAYKDELRAALKSENKKAWSTAVEKFKPRALLGAALPAAAYLTYRKLKK